MSFITGAKKDLILLKMLKNKQVRGLDKSFLLFLRKALKYEKFVKIDNQYVIASQLPPFPGEAFDRFLSISKFAKIGKPVPASCYIAVTQRCNMKCWHCSNWYRGDVKDFPKDLLLDTIGKLQDMGNCMIGITGGEPLLRDDIEDIIKEIGSKSTVLLFTNGTLLTPERAKELKKAGLFYISISLDHYKKEVFDKLRGYKGAFESALSALENAKNAGLYTRVTATPPREIINLNEMMKFHEFVKNLNVHEFCILNPLPVGRLSGENKGWGKSVDEDKIREYNRKISVDKKYPRICAWSYSTSGGVLGCTAGTYHIYIECSGAVIPCVWLPLTFGNIREDRGIEKSYEIMSSRFKIPRKECYVRAAFGLLNKAFEEEGGKIPFSREKAREISTQCQNKRMPEFFERLGTPNPNK